MSHSPLPPEPTVTNRDQRRANVRLALILASVALAFMLGVVAKMAFFAG